MIETQTNDLYICPNCGHIDHDDQDGTGHWEQGGCTIEGAQEAWPGPFGWSYWILACNKCGEVNNMPKVPLPVAEILRKLAADAPTTPAKDER